MTYTTHERSASPSLRPGLNLIGHPYAELGMGEHVRMSAASLATTDVPFEVVNFSRGVLSRQQATLEHGVISSGGDYGASLYHINADQMLLAFCTLGPDFFRDRFNIGFWFWELSKFPEIWHSSFDLVDELWAPSKYLEQVFSVRKGVPVVYQPVSVVLPDFARRERAYFRLPTDTYLFTFVFDFLSFIERKNPYACIRAFKAAFPGGQEKAGLVIKVMNGQEGDPRWQKMLALIDGDPRVHVINATMERGDLLALVDTCDAFVSLHRAEGFGRGPAEAMYLGKPVVVTNYSGNTEFTLPDNACLVDYQLIAVGRDEYVHPEGQVWADADVEHAAWHMRKLYQDPVTGRQIGARAREFIGREYSPARVGAAYRQRLARLKLV